MSNEANFRTNFTVCDLTSSNQTEFYNYWNKLRGNRPCPARADIEPTSIVKILPYITLIEKISTDYRVRLMGTYSASIFGEKTGRFLSETGYNACALNQLRCCSENGRPQFQIRSLKHHSNRYRKSSVLAMPLSLHGQDIDMIALVHDFY